MTYPSGRRVHDELDDLGVNDQDFQYDALNRLTFSSGKYGEIDYTYDGVGNRLSRTIEDDSATTNETYQYERGSHRIERVTSNDDTGTDSRQFAHDNNGNIVSDVSGDRELKMNVNARNRLETIWKDGKRVGEYQYNALGQRVAKTSRYRGRLHSHFDQGNKTKSSGAPERANVISTGAAAGRGVEKSLTLYYIHNDHLGTPKKVTDGQQRIVWSMKQTPFGEVALTTEAIRMPMRFPGQYADIETGFSYNYFRDYDPSFGRYIQSDPIGLNGGINIYGYVAQNPLIYTDPTGLLCGTGACVIGAATVVGVVVGGAQGIATVSNGGNFFDGAVSGFGFDVGATTVAIVGGGTALATGLGVAVGFGIDLLFTGGAVAGLLAPNADAAPIDSSSLESPNPVDDAIQGMFCSQNPNAPNCNPEPSDCL